MLDYNKVIPNMPRKEFFSALETIVTSNYFGQYQLSPDNALELDREFSMDLRGQIKSLGAGWTFPELKKVSKILVGAFDQMKESKSEAKVKLTIYPSMNLYNEIGIKIKDMEDEGPFFPLTIGNDLLIKSTPANLSLGIMNLGLKNHCTNKRIISALKNLHIYWNHYLDGIFPGKFEDSNEVYRRQRQGADKL